MGTCAASTSCALEDDIGGHSPRLLPRGAGINAARSGRTRDGIGEALELTRRLHGSQPLQVVAECYQPVLLIIAKYAAESPQVLARLCSSSPSFQQRDLELNGNIIWGQLFRQRWPAFYECLHHHGAGDWRRLYRETLIGHLECTLEVFDREKKRGFAMSAMPARIMYDSKRGKYVARYLSASKVLPEGIPLEEEHRLRFCPASARDRLLPNGVLEGSASLDRAEATQEQLKPPENREEYPYRVLRDRRDLVPGQGVELQWKMQRGSPFGWWYGQLESVRHDEATGLSTARITFRHFPPTSRWYQLDVCFGDATKHPCDFGGFTGGIRAVSEIEQKRWASFFPKELLHF